jgi:hypothetical protein
LQGSKGPSPYTVEILLEALRAVCHTYCGVVPGATASHGLPPALLKELAPPTHAQAAAGAAARLERCIGVALSSIGSLAMVSHYSSSPFRAARGPFGSLLRLHRFVAL